MSGFAGAGPRTERAEIIDVRSIGPFRTRECLSLVPAPLVPLIENIPESWIVLEQPLIEMLCDRRAMFGKDRGP